MAKWIQVKGTGLEEPAWYKCSECGCEDASDDCNCDVVCCERCGCDSVCLHEVTLVDDGVRYCASCDVEV